ncbi:uncharacterized protein [Dermacentor albipictus]|uniref:uncharacterized protein n=1 Tax=Dermacentor albipictus TaxID=60249 RepID=UPI0038FD2EA5
MGLLMGSFVQEVEDLMQGGITWTDGTKSISSKVLEHAFLNRINGHLEETEAYPHTMVGFRSRLSMQDVMLQLKNQILDDKTRNTRAVLGLDLEKAFDSVAHESILIQVSNLNLWERAYNYVRDFLNDYKATLTVGDLESEERTQGSAEKNKINTLIRKTYTIALVLTESTSTELLTQLGIYNTLE